MTDFLIKEQFDLKDIAKEIKGDIFDELDLDVKVKTKIRKKKKSAIEIECPVEFNDKIYEIAKRYVGMVYNQFTRRYEINFVPELKNV